MAEVNVTIGLRKRRWLGVALTMMAIVCALVSLVSGRTADWLSDKGAGLLSRYGFIYEVV